jgi:hypothetical protein
MSEERTLTQDLTLGLGRFRWSDDAAAIRALYPDARWGKVEPVYAAKKAFLLEQFDVSESLTGQAILDPDTGGTQMLRINVPEESWPALAELARALGAEEVPETFTSDDVLAWEVASVEIEIAEDSDFGGIYFRLERALSARAAKGAPVNPLDDTENFDFDD